MAQLKSTVVLGDLRVTDSLTASTLTGSLAVANLVGIDTSSGSTSKCLTEKGTFASFGTSNLAIGSGSNQAMAGNTTVTNVAISANVTTNANYPVVFATSNKDTTAAKNEGVQKSGTKFYFNPSTGNLVSTTFNSLTLTAATTGFTIAGGTTSKTLTVNNTYTLGAACAKGVTDNSSATAVTSSDTNLITGRTLYYAGYVKSSGVTSITIKTTSPLSGGSDTATTGTGTYTLSLGGLTSYGTAGQVLKVNSSANGLEWGTVSGTDEKVKVTARGTTKAYLLASTSATSDGTTAVAESDVYLGTTAGHLYATAVHNAVWNDYAEYRHTLSQVKPGQCVIDNDDGSLSVAAKRLLPGAQIVSDTWGHIMGETDDAKTPVAVAGRVLAYTTQPRENYHAGMAVCSGPNGTVDIMTREEIKEYPDCIIGYVSEIPNYETWGSGNVKVNGRIWVRVK